MGWEEDIAVAIKKYSRYMDQVQDKKDKAQEQMEAIFTIADEQQIDYYQTDYGTYLRIPQNKLCGPRHDLDAFLTEFPDLNAIHFWNSVCKLDPKLGCDECKPKKPDEIESRLSEHPELTSEQKDRIRVILDIRTREEKVLTQAQVPDPAPAGWPYDEE